MFGKSKSSSLWPREGSWSWPMVDDQDARHFYRLGGWVFSGFSLELPSKKFGTPFFNYVMYLSTWLFFMCCNWIVPAISIFKICIVWEPDLDSQESLWPQRNSQSDSLQMRVTPNGLNITTVYQVLLDTSTWPAQAFKDAYGSPAFFEDVSDAQ